jgi:hypothetical protein
MYPLPSLRSITHLDILSLPMRDPKLVSEVIDGAKVLSPMLKKLVIRAPLPRWSTLVEQATNLQELHLFSNDITFDVPRLPSLEILVTDYSAPIMHALGPQKLPKLRRAYVGGLMWMLRELFTRSPSISGDISVSELERQGWSSRVDVGALANRYPYTPLLATAATNQPRLALTLLTHAKTRGLKVDTEVCLPDSGHTPLLAFAANPDALQVVNLLLQLGADVNYVSKGGDTALCRYDSDLHR